MSMSDRYDGDVFFARRNMILLPVTRCLRWLMLPMSTLAHQAGIRFWKIHRLAGWFAEILIIYKGNNSNGFPVPVLEIFR